MQLEAIKTMLAMVKETDADIAVLELMVEKRKRVYTVLGVYMRHSEKSLRVAFNAKNNVVIDNLDIPLQEIQSVRVVREDEIENFA